MTAPIHVVFVALLSMSIVSVSAAETSLSCEAFEVKPDGSVTVVKATALATPYGKISLQPGMRFSSKVKLMGSGGLVPDDRLRRTRCRNGPCSERAIDVAVLR